MINSGLIDKNCGLIDKNFGFNRKCKNSYILTSEFFYTSMLAFTILLYLFQEQVKVNIIFVTKYQWV